MRTFLLALFVGSLFVMGCASSQPVDVDLAEQNQTNIETTNTGTVELLDMLDAAKEENPKAEWAKTWNAGVRISHEMQSEANTKVAGKLLTRAKERNTD